MAVATDDRPGWIDPTEYPFESHYADLGPGRLHYVDEGEGRPVVMLHGNPTWSFLYRRFIEGLSDEYRTVAPDYIGFGLSEKPHSWSYRPADHAAVFAEFVDDLDLDGMTLVVHDWGGPIGLSYALDHPDRVRALVLANTFMWPMDDDLGTRVFSGLLGGPLGRVLCERYNAFARWVMPLAFGDRSRLTPAVHDHYLRPLAEPSARKGTWVFPREIVGSSSWLADRWASRDAIADLPALLLWGLRDPAFGETGLHRWLELFSDARAVGYDDAGHYVQEEAGPKMVAEVREFLEGT